MGLLLGRGPAPSQQQAGTGVTGVPDPPPSIPYCPFSSSPPPLRSLSLWPSMGSGGQLGSRCPAREAWAGGSQPVTALLLAAEQPLWLSVDPGPWPRGSLSLLGQHDGQYYLVSFLAPLQVVTGVGGGGRGGEHVWSAAFG